MLDFSHKICMISSQMVNQLFFQFSGYILFCIPHGIFCYTAGQSSQLSCQDLQRAYSYRTADTLCHTCPFRLTVLLSVQVLSYSFGVIEIVLECQGKIVFEFPAILNW